MIYFICFLYELYITELKKYTLNSIIITEGVVKMENEKYLSEERYQRNNQKVKSVGKVLLIIGIVTLVISFIMIILGFMGFGNTAVSSIGSESFDNGTMQKTASGIFGSFGLFAIGGFINTIGFALTAAGGITMFIAHRREITAYTTQQVMPVAQEGIEKITPTVANAAGSIAQSISKGIQEGKKEADNK